MEEDKNIKKEELEEKGKPFDTAQDELKALQLKCEEYLNGWKRERADFLNHKKEEMERIGIIIKYANEELILKILPILDNFYLAEKHMPEELKEERPSSSVDSSGQTSADAKVWIEGFVQIKKQLEDFLSKEGIEVIKTLGEPFDANIMEAVEEVPARNASPARQPDGSHGGGHSDAGGQRGTVVEETQRGYTLHGKVIRPAKVRVVK